MPKRVTTIATTVVRASESDPKKMVRKEVAAGKSFDFTTEEIADLNRIHPGALRMPINESADSAATDETSPEKTAKATAATPNKRAPKKTAAEADSTSKAATADDGDDGADDGAAADDAAGEDDDI